ncbi:MAG TPA: Stk1 family PASTA domain-containing Ser/Thr kinase [Actinomycetota bacterium]|nr:Stk1 family PASTA domain-containing Ser/Thr kinase [Actinomycetota bacterium]
MSESLLGGRYRVEAQIGAGGMAQVFRGQDTLLGRAVAIKVLAQQFAKDQSFVSRFRREAEAAARLNHPNVVGVFDTGSDDGTHYIVMELVEGRTLSDFLSKGGRLTPDRAGQIAESVCRALAVAHKHGVVHRDVKSGNIMVTRDGEVKVMDFGIARLETGAETIAQTAAVLGTASYLSPEQARGEKVDARSDIYSLGIVLYEMVTGRVPFTGDSPVAVAYKHVQEAPDPPSKLNPDVTPALDAIVLRCLAKNPANRYQTATDLREDLERARTGKPVQATPLLPSEETVVIGGRRASGGQTQVLSPTGPPPTRRKWWVPVLVALLVLGALGAGFWLFARGLLSEPKTVSVPSVIGFTEAEARSRLENEGLEVGNVEEEISEEQPGTVIRQDPKARSFVREGQEVDLWIAKPVPLFEVPSVVGLDQDAAIAEIESAKLTWTVVPEESTEPVGRVIRQDPLAGDEVERGSEVTIFVSSGPPDVEVPDVICYSFGHARSVLDDRGLVGVDAGTVPADPRCPNGSKVAMQDPSARKVVPAGTVVQLYLGEEVEPPPTTPPPSP